VKRSAVTVAPTRTSLQSTGAAGTYLRMHAIKTAMPASDTRKLKLSISIGGTGSRLEKNVEIADNAALTSRETINTNPRLRTRPNERMRS